MSSTHVLAFNSNSFRTKYLKKKKKKKADNDNFNILFIDKSSIVIDFDMNVVIGINRNYGKQICEKIRCLMSLFTVLTGATTVSQCRDRSLIGTGRAFSMQLHLSVTKWSQMWSVLQQGAVKQKYSRKTNMHLTEILSRRVRRFMYALDVARMRKKL